MIRWPNMYKNLKKNSLIFTPIEQIYMLFFYCIMIYAALIHMNSDQFTVNSQLCPDKMDPRPLLAVHYIKTGCITIKWLFRDKN